MTNDDREPLSSSQAALVGAGFITGAVIVGGIAWWMKEFLAGDEPPIRVKGGSLHLDIGGGATWKMVGTDRKKWKPSRGTRGKEEYDVSIVGLGPGCVEKGPMGKKIRVSYVDGSVTEVVEIKAPGKKTMVESTAPLKLEEGGQRLTLAGGGHISRFEVDSSACTFGPDEFDHALLSDF